MKSKKSKFPYKRRCSVLNCHNNSHDQSDISYHRLPTNERVKKEWIKKCFTVGTEQRLEHKFPLVCSKHFKPYDYCSSWLSNGKFIFL